MARATDEEILAHRAVRLTTKPERTVAHGSRSQVQWC